MAIDMQKHKQEVTEERLKVQDQLDKLKEQLAELDAELRAVDAYEKARAPKNPVLTEQTVARAPRGAKRQAVLEIIKDKPGGINRADIINALGAKGNKADEQSVSNALAALTKNNEIANNDGTYMLA